MEWTTPAQFSAAPCFCGLRIYSAGFSAALKRVLCGGRECFLLACEVFVSIGYPATSSFSPRGGGERVWIEL